LDFQIEDLSDENKKIFKQIKKVMRKENFIFEDLFIEPFLKKSVIKKRSITIDDFSKVLFGAKYLNLNESKKL